MIGRFQMSFKPFLGVCTRIVQRVALEIGKILLQFPIVVCITLDIIFNVNQKLHNLIVGTLYLDADSLHLLISSETS